MAQTTPIALLLTAFIVVSTTEAAELASEPTTAPDNAAEQRFQDVVLQSDGSLTGLIRNETEKPRKAVPVRLRFKGQDIAAANTDKAGRFKFRGVRPGLHTVSAESTLVQVRAWDSKTAPPAAQKTVFVTNRRKTVDSEGSKPCKKKLCRRPILVAGILAAAGGITAISVNHSSKPSSP